MVERSRSELALENAYHWEKVLADRAFLTQPMGGGVVREWTWKQAMDETRRMAAHLSSLGLAPGTRIAMLAKNQAHFIMADIAIWMAGHISVPLYPTLAATTIAQILEHSEAQLIFIGKLDAYESMKPGIPASMPRILLPLTPEKEGDTWDAIIARTEPMKESPTRPADDLATLVYTSGSTGVPKGVMHSFYTMGTSAVRAGTHMSIGHEDRMLSYLPLAHVFERWVVEMGCIMGGFQVFFAESLDTFVNDLKRARPTIFVSVPRLWLKFQGGVFAKMPQQKLSRLLKIPVVSYFVKKKVLAGLGLDHVRFAGSGSAPIPPEVIDWYQSLGLQLLEGYGMTENFAYSHISNFGRARAGYVGEPLPGVEQRISPEGEIQIKSPGSMVGYYKADELTKEAFTDDGFLKTGDRGEIDSEGRLKITGRVKELFKTSKGKYVAPAPIENLLLANSLLEQSCVSGAGQPQPHALVVLAEQTRNDLAAGTITNETIANGLAALLADINPKLDPHEQLDFLAVAKEPWLVENGLLTPTMKIRRGEIENRYAPMIEGWYEKKKKVVWEA
jgi:long-chain acyl-CoA synthetase